MLFIWKHIMGNLKKIYLNSSSIKMTVLHSVGYLNSNSLIKLKLKGILNGAHFCCEY